MDKQNAPVMRYDLSGTDTRLGNSTRVPLVYREVKESFRKEPRLLEPVVRLTRERKKEEEIELDIEVHLAPKRTTPAILHARHVGRAKPVVTFDFVDDEIIDW